RRGVAASLPPGTKRSAERAERRKPAGNYQQPLLEGSTGGLTPRRSFGTNDSSWRRRFSGRQSPTGFKAGDTGSKITWISGPAVHGSEKRRRRRAGQSRPR